MSFALVASVVTVATLLGEMNDLDHLTEPAAYTARQFSSYDRASHTPEGWFANGDCGNYLRKEGDELVLAEAAGPGAITRIWSANPAGRLRIWLDGAIALEEDFAKLLRGEVKPFVAPFGQLCASGGNLYFPFPYARSMKVTCNQGGEYYHVDCRTYAPGTEVETFSRAAVERLVLPDLERVRDPAGEVVAARSLEGPGIVRELEVQLPEDPNELRSKLIRITVDGEPCVCVPLGDFFGTAPGRTPYRSLPLGITKDGVGWCRFPMPFARSFEVDVDAFVRLHVTRGEARGLRFHAWWNGSNALKTRPMSDWPVLHAEGRGRYVGTFLAVRNPVKAWWGEGDEKVFVDDDTFPSTFGTGTEDYFGYAWCSRELFQAPYHDQTRCDGPGNRGQTAVARFHILDDIPFARKIRFDLEVWHWADTTIGYATVAYWYAEPGCLHRAAVPDPKDTAIVPLPEIAGVPGAIEGESLAVLETTSGVAGPQDMGPFGDGWSRDGQLWWHGARPGDRLRLRFESAVAGKHSLVLALTKAPDYGIVKITVDGRPLDTGVDLYADKVLPAGERVYADVALEKGPNELVVEVVGTNEAAHPKSYMFGLDYLRIADH